MNLCACGCGKEVTREGNKYKSNHHIRGKKGQEPWNKGLKMSEEFCQAVSKGHIGQVAWNLGVPRTKEEKRKISESLIGLCAGINNPMFGKQHTEETKKKISNAKKGQIPINKGTKMSYEQRQKLSMLCLGRESAFKGKTHTYENKILSSERQKQIWQDSDYVAKQMKARNIKQNKTEQKLQFILNELCPNEYKFVGDGEVIIAGKCPDFINVNGQKKIIELFGDYWHKGEDPQDRINIFKPYGYETLVIWEKELKNIDLLKNNIIQFHECNGR